MMKAYLAHSASDDQIVRAVASELGPARSIYFRREFEIGDDFLTAMTTALSQSRIFVLFASKESLASKPVQFEIAEAQRLQLVDRAILRSLVFIIDDELSIKGLPDWLQRSVARKVAAPKIIAQEILHQQASLERNVLSSLFINRSNEVTQIESHLFPVDGTPSPSVFSIFGLQGMGRRRLASEIGKTRLSLMKSRSFTVGRGDTIVEFALDVSAFVEDPREDLVERREDLKTQSVDEIVASIIPNLSKLIDNGILPIIHDGGGLVDADNKLVRAFESLLAAVSAAPGLYLALASPRLMESASLPFQLPQTRVSVLKPDDTQRLMAATAPALGIFLDSQKIAALSRKLYGHPPAVLYALEEVRQFGAEVFLRDERRMVQWRVDYFIDAIQHDRKLTRDRLVLLKTLAFYGPLPIEIIGSVGALSHLDGWLADLRHLSNSALVDPYGDDAYALPEPITDAVSRVTEELELNHGAIAEALRTYIAANPKSEMRLHLRRKLAIASMFSGSREIDRFLFASDLLAAVQESYDRQDYRATIDFANEYIDLQQTSLARGHTDAATLLNALRLAAKAHVKVGEFDKGLERIEDMRAVSPRDAYFMAGFLERRRTNLLEAAKNFEAALARNYRGVAIHREIAEVYFFLDRLDKAAEHIAEAYRLKPENRFVADLEAKIATLRGDEPLARQRLHQLKIVDREPYYYYRLSVVEMHFKHLEEAYHAAAESVRLGDSRVISHLEQLFRTEIGTNRLESAGNTLNRLEKNPNARQRVAALRAEWEIANHAFEDALVTLEKSPRKAGYEYISLRLHAIEGLKATLRVDHPRQVALDEEARGLSDQLKRLRPPVHADERDIPDIDHEADDDEPA